MKSTNRSSLPVAVGFEGTDRDAATLRTARRIAERRMRAIDEARDFLKLNAFRAELGATIRCVTPLLTPLLALQDTTLNDAVWTIQPPTGWPQHPRVGTFVAGQSCGCRLTRRHFDFAGGVRTRCPFCSHDRGSFFSITRGSWFRLDVFRHSLEVAGRLGPIRFASELGRLNIEPGIDLPIAVRSACVGKLIEEVIDHEIFLGRGWKIVDVAEAPLDSGRTVLIADTEFVAYRMPWAR
ncbi:hypothetical protein ACFSC3_08955 [Sphingomonas floccifaciens]|uniref:Uncharacterized protein n=1 Tax=Sphingomonas floccifaciens TaxID=1844115 RepID=A0ABW4NFW6_9SPHN